MVEIDPAACKSYFEAVSEKQLAHERHFSGARQFCLYYEDLLDNTEGVLAQVQGFLGLSVEQLATTYKKRGTRPLHESISNFNELQGALEHGRWAAYLQE